MAESEDTTTTGTDSTGAGIAGTAAAETNGAVVPPRKAAARRAPRKAVRPPAELDPAALHPAELDPAALNPAASAAPIAESADPAPAVEGAPATGTRARRPRKAAAKAAPALAAPTSDAAPTGSVADVVPGVEPESSAAPNEPETSAAPTKAKRAPRKRATKAVAGIETAATAADPTAANPAATDPTAADPTATDPTAANPAATDPAGADPTAADPTAPAGLASTGRRSTGRRSGAAVTPVFAAPAVLFQPPTAVIGEPEDDVAPSAEGVTAPRRRPARGRKAAVAAIELPSTEDGLDGLAFPIEDVDLELTEAGGFGADTVEDSPSGVAGSEEVHDDEGEDVTETGGVRRRRRRGRRGRGPRSTEDVETADSETDPAVEEDADEATDGDDADSEESGDSALSASARRRRRRRRSTAGDAEAGEDDPPNTVVHLREPKSEPKSTATRGSAADSDGVRGVKGSTRLEAKRQRRRDSRDSGRRRAPILTEAEFLARRESVDRVMAVRQIGDRTQIAVLEDGILVEHYVTRESAASAVGNVYLGRVQNVLPSMEAAFVDIGRGRNGVLYAGEVNWDAAGLEGKSRAIEDALNSGDTVLVQVTKDPIGHKGARLTSQISLPGRYVVYVPGGGMTGISRKLPDTERSRLKSILKKVVPDEAGVIVRTAAEGATEADLISDVERLKAQWEAIEAKNAQSSNAPALVYGEPDLAIRVVRDVFNDDFSKLVVSGSDSYATLTSYIADIAPELSDRVFLHTGESDLFTNLRVDEQLAKALDRKVWLPSGGSLVIDRTEAMVVVDVNTGKYTGSGGNLEQTVTRNNLEAAEELVRQLRLRDIGGIVVIDFIDMVLESNRDLVLRRLTECLGRDRTKHQVAEVTSLGLVQMTRKRVGEGLLEAFSEPCEHCNGRGVILHAEPTVRLPEELSTTDGEDDRTGRSRRGRRGGHGPAVVDALDEVLIQNQRRAAAAAIAAIAAATANKDEHRVEPSGEAPSGVETVEPSRVEPSGVEPVDPSKVERFEVESAASRAAAQSEDQRVPAELPAPPLEASSVQQFEPEQPGHSVAVGRPRRRRAASRPAGPPVPVRSGG